MEALRSYLQQFLTITDKDWLEICQKFEVGNCQKNEILTASGGIEDRIYFLQEGLVRLYIEQNVKDITINFGFPGSFFSCYTSFLTGEVSDFEIAALSPCSFYSITKEHLESLYESTTCGHQLGRVILEKMFIYLSSRENAFLLKSPTERYLDLFTEQPQLIQHIPQKYLASYIGITPQALSRIRAKLSSQD